MQNYLLRRGLGVTSCFVPLLWRLFSAPHCRVHVSFRGYCRTPINARSSSSSSGTSSHVPKTPSIIFFGGDTVSLVALKMLHERLLAIRTSETTSGPPQMTTTAEGKPQLVVICPFLPADPSAISRRHRRQYPVARYCVEHGIPLLPVDHPTSLTRSGTLRYLLHPWNPALQSDASVDMKKEGENEEKGEYIAGQPLEAFDVAVVVSFRYFLPKKLLERLPRTVNLHPSLLPRYRGASPIFAPLLRGDTVGGVSIIKLSPGQRLMDSGDVLWQQSVPISPDMTIRDYFPLVTKLGAAGLCTCLFGGSPPLGPDPNWRDVENPADMVTDVSTSRTCDWPQTFDAHWAAAWPQKYDVHFTQDPFHAPLLAKDRAVIRWHTMTAEEAYGTWRAFAGGEYFSPTVNATLDKGATPMREQLLRRLLMRAAREIKKKLFYCRHHGSSDSGGEIATELAVPLVVGPLRKNGLTNEDMEMVENAELLTPKAETHHHLYRHLFISCTFTDALHPREVPSAVVRELHQLEEGEPVATAKNIFQHHHHHCSVKNHIVPGSAYFPRSVDNMCAVKCREGWFVWQAAALKGSSSQPANLLCKGMAMKAGVLYTAVFVEDTAEHQKKNTFPCEDNHKKQ